MSEWIIELVNTIGLIVGFALMFYFGRITGENNVAESERRYEVLYQKEVLQRKVYYEKYNDIHYVLENLTGDDVKLLTKDNWNTIILKKNKETEEDEPIDWVGNGQGHYFPIYSRK